MTKTATITAILGMVIVLAGTAAPVIEVDDPIHDFGTVMEGLSTEHAFVLRNAGDEDLEVTAVRVSCGCTTPALDKTGLAPGEEVDLTTLLNTYRLQGAVEKTITVASNDPETPELTLHLVGEVTPPPDHMVPGGELNYLFYLLIDVRDPDLYAAGHLLGAINIPYEELPAWSERLPKRVLMVVYGQDDAEGERAALGLAAAGFGEARGLVGGLDEWTRQYAGRYMIEGPVD